MVVIERPSLEQLCIEHLSDTTTYDQLKINTADAMRLKMHKNFKEVLSSCQFPSLTYNLPKLSLANSQCFHALPKTHKKLQI